MGNSEKFLREEFMENRPIRCEKCKGKLFYTGSGTYTCEDCEHVMLDDFGKVKAYLEEHGIGTIIHYPVPPHLAEAYEYLGYREGAFPITEGYANTVLSIPMYNGMTEEEQTRVIECLNAF